MQHPAQYGGTRSQLLSAYQSCSAIQCTHYAPDCMLPALLTDEVCVESVDLHVEDFLDCFGLAYFVNIDRIARFSCNSLAGKELAGCGPTLVYYASEKVLRPASPLFFLNKCFRSRGVTSPKKHFRIGARLSYYVG